MTTPKAKNIDKNALFIWDDTNKEYKAWDGVLSTGDIEIGAVELKDGDSDTRADIELDSAKNALYVQSETLATSAKQLLDNHQVTVSNPTADPETGLATSAKQLADGHNVTVDNASIAVTGTFFQGTQPVSGTVTATPSGTQDVDVTANTIGLATSAKQLADGHNVIQSNTLVPANYDYIALTYVAAGNGAGEVETAIYKTGGAGGSTVGTLTLAYNASDEISSITKT